ncbi:MAG: DEAD/DEAH box helicase [Thiotrichales bacterium]|nr:DEAD/DEAH box helicase [Thiotrichales bacterium]
MREILAGLRQPDALDVVKIGETLKGTLRPYQHQGLSWLRLLTGLGLGACLADDMGLGKTIQVLALLLCERRGGAQGPGSPSLLVVPASLLGNWRSEAARFAPSLKLRFLHPSETDRQSLAEIAAAPGTELAGTDLVVTTYAMLVRQTWLVEMSWRLVILDEAQAIKNPATRQSRAVRKLPADARIALTGTPVENRLADLWSLFDFLNPGLLGSRKVFQSFVDSLEAREENPYAPLRRLVGPYILRRLKTDRAIIGDLPEKTETACYCSLTRAQVKLYGQVVRTMQRELESVVDLARRGVVLRSLLRLKQVCNHPSQLLGDGEYTPADSGKFLRLADICEELAERQEKVLIFTQFREIIDPLAEHLTAVFGRSGLVLHGTTGVRQRRVLVDRFQSDDGPPFFILSLRAGGTGLNLIAASHVIHFDRWWNPAVENQATDRAFRIGQRRNVLVHKFMTTGTVEERIAVMIAEKQKLADDILAGDGEVNLTELSDEALMDLVRLDVTRAALMRT